MKRFLITIEVILAIATPSFAGVNFHGTTGQTLYVRVQTGATTFVSAALPEGLSGPSLGVYSVSDADLTGLPNTSSAAANYPNGFPFTIRSGSANITNNDPIVGTGSLPWSGTAELPIGLTSQQARDALKLAPSSGSPATGSVDAAVAATEQHSQFAGDFADGITAATSGAPTLIAGVEDAMTAQGYTTARAAKLDNLAPSLLLNTAISGAPPSQTTLVLSAGPPDDGALNGALIVVTSLTNPARKAVGLIKGYVASTKTVTLVADPGIYTMASGDSVDVIAAGPAVPLWLAH